MTKTTDLEKAQRILEGRCAECGAISPKHMLSCSNLVDFRYMFGNHDQYEIIDSDHDYPEQH